jgi:hypothetical protein
MKRTLIFLCILCSSTLLPAAELKRHVELEKEIQGDWISAEYFVPQPALELQQFIKTISFQPDNIVEWEYVKDGKVNKVKGRYGIYTFPADEKKIRQLPSLTVAPEAYKDPLLSSNRLLYLSDVELDLDCRFPQSWGKLIKARSLDGKRLLFLRKENKINSFSFHNDAKEIGLSKKETINELIKNIDQLNVKQVIFRNYGFKNYNEYENKLNAPEEINKIIQAMIFEPITGLRRPCNCNVTLAIQFKAENYDDREEIRITVCEHCFEVLEGFQTERNRHYYKMPSEFYKLIMKYFK